MGRVYKARDKTLSRLVALKFMRDDSPDLIGRFLREAQAQARLDHEHICKVFEVGESDARMYIVMQYIQGESLKALRQQLGTEQKVDMVRKVAEGLHTAHRQGLVHRDIKPANIMVEKRDDGTLHPYLMDFGLAREAYTQGQTMTGTVEGTPAYMAPEQVRGEIHRLDRRTDVYSLGATLYELLAGQPPFVGETSLDILMNVAGAEPKPLRSIESSVAVDLETIVMKCLEKDPVRRYDSAKALAIDLRRWLDGEPVLARRASLGYVLLKRAQKHKALVMLGGMGILAVLVLSVMYFRGKTIARRQAVIAQELGQDVKEIELFMRYALTLPAHDVEREKEVIRERIRRMETRSAGGGREFQGPVQYALGRGHLLLDEPEQAVEALEEALKAGFGTPDVELALGRARSALYIQALNEARRVDDPRLKAKREKEVEERYLAPALKHFQKSHGASDMPAALIEAWIAQLEKRFSEAARHAEEAARVTPWLAEPRELLGQALMAESRQAADRGDFEAALESLAKATLTLEEAAGISRSDADIHEAIVDAWMLRLDIERNRSRITADIFEKTIEACKRATTLDAKRATVFQKQTRAQWLWSIDQMTQREDPRPLVQQSMESARIALDLDPKDAITLDIVGNSYISLARYDSENGRDPRPLLNLALEYFEQSINADPHFAWPYNDAGIVFNDRATYEIDRGLDPTQSLSQSEEYFERAHRSDPQYEFPITNATFLASLRAHYSIERGIDPGPALQRAAELCTGDNENELLYLWCLDARLNTAVLRADYQRMNGISPLEDLAEPLKNTESTIKDGAPTLKDTLWSIASAYRVQAHYLLQSGGNPEENLAKGLAAIEKALELGPNSSNFLLEQAKLTLLSARHAIQLKKDPSERLQRAQDTLEKITRKNNTHAEAWMLLAELWLLRAPKDNSALQLGLEAADRALSIHPKFAMAFAFRARLRNQKAAQAKNPAEKAALLAQAQRDYEQALEMNAFLTRELKPELEDLKAIIQKQ